MGGLGQALISAQASSTASKDKNPLAQHRTAPPPVVVIGIIVVPR